jgi:copper chaperone NosL
MGHGILAVSNEAQAQKIAADVNGVILDWGHARVEMALAGHH